MGEIPRTLPWYFAAIIIGAWIAVVVVSVALIRWRRAVRAATRVEVLSRRRPPDPDVLELEP